MIPSQLYVVQQKNSNWFRSGIWVDQATSPHFWTHLPSQFSLKNSVTSLSKSGGAPSCCSLIHPCVARDTSSKYIYNSFSRKFLKYGAVKHPLITCGQIVHTTLTEHQSSKRHCTASWGFSCSQECNSLCWWHHPGKLSVIHAQNVAHNLTCGCIHPQNHTNSQHNLPVQSIVLFEDNMDTNHHCEKFSTHMSVLHQSSCKSCLW